MTTAPILYQISIAIDQSLANSIELWIEYEEDTAWSIHEAYDNDGKITAYELKGFFESPEIAEASFEALKLEFQELPTSVEIELLEPKVWQEAYKEHLQPWSYNTLHWVPVWRLEDYSLPAGDTLVKLDPGMAFGTGRHETTRLLGQRLADWGPLFPEKSPALRVMDAGCGSGILALTAYQLGLRNIKGFDIDPDAVRIAKEHLSLNQLSPDSISFFEATLTEGLKNGPWDILLANIQTEVLAPHAELLLKSLSPKSVLLLSGILIKEKDLMLNTLKEAAQHLGWTAHLEYSSQDLGDWCDILVSLRK